MHLAYHRLFFISDLHTDPDTGVACFAIYSVPESHALDSVAMSVITAPVCTKSLRIRVTGFCVGPNKFSFDMADVVDAISEADPEKYKAIRTRVTLDRRVNWVYPVLDYGKPVKEEPEPKPGEIVSAVYEVEFSL